MKKMKKMFFAVLTCVLFMVCPAWGMRAAAADANPSYTFQTIDGGTFSTTADGTKAATVLIFGRTTCMNSGGTLRSIANSSWIHDKNVKVAFFEIDQASSATVKEYAGEYGCEEMTFCYDSGTTAHSVLWKYAQMGGYTNSVPLPVIALVDSANRVQEVMTGYTSAKELYSAMSKFATVEGGEEYRPVDIAIQGTEDYDAAKEVFELVNQTRQAAGVPALQLDASLCQTARIRAAEIAIDFSHTRPNGEDCFSLFRNESGGENIAVYYFSASAVMDGWNNSPGHYTNIVNRYFTSIGIGCFVDTDGRRYWVQCFDGYPAVTEEKSGTAEVARDIEVLRSKLNFSVNSVYYVTCGAKENEKRLSVYASGYYGAEVSASNFNFSSSDASVAEVDAEGVIHFKKSGSAGLTVTLKADPSITMQSVAKKYDHKWGTGMTTKKPTCIAEGEMTYACSSCGETKTELIEKTDSHTYNKTSVTKATLSANGSIAAVCSLCGQADPSSAYTIPYPKTIALAKTSYTYDGKAKKPAVTVRDANGQAIGIENYSVSYAGGLRKVGSYTVTVKFKGDCYEGEKKLSFTVNPAGTTLKSVKAGKKKITVKWNKKTSQVKGYEIQYSTDKKFKAKGTKTVTAKKNSTTEKSITKLSAKKKYYVRIRTYQEVAGKKYYSEWSREKSATTKK